MAVIDPFVEFAENPEPRCPCVLLLDTSGSMSGPPITELNQGLRIFEEEIKKDSVARLRVDLAIICFETNVELVQDFITVEDFTAPYLVTGGITAMGEAIHFALDKLSERKQQYKQFGIRYYRPWLWLITDGAPTDREVFLQAANRLKAEEAAKGVHVFPVGVAGADIGTLSQVSALHRPIHLEGLSFSKMFVWLSNSFSSVSKGEPPRADDVVGAQAPLPPLDWGSVAL